MGGRSTDTSQGRRFRDRGGAGRRPDRVAQLERKVGQQALEIDFLKGCLQSIEEQRQLQAAGPQPPYTGKSKRSERESSG